MQVKLSFANEPKVYMPNGLEIGRRFIPTGVAIQFLISKLVERAIGAEIGLNRSHKCTATCGRVAKMVVGGVGVSLKYRVPNDMVEMVGEFEELVNSKLDDDLEWMQVKAVGLMFTPCAKKTEVLNSAVYLK